MPPFAAHGIRLTLAVTLMLLASLVVFKPPVNLLWKVSIGVKEAGHYLVLPSLLLVLGCLASPGPAGKISAALALGATLLFALPLGQSVMTARRLDSDFRDFLRERPGPPAPTILRRTRPLSARDLAMGLSLPKVKPVTLVYAQRSGAELWLDFYPARAGSQGVAGKLPASGAPCVVVIHGGGWDSGDRRQLHHLNHFLAAAGIAVAALDYRLAPTHRYPDPVLDVREALAFLSSRAADLGLDPGRFVLLGRSAGGQVALQAAYTRVHPGIRGVVAFYAPADMVFGYSLPVNHRLMDSRLLMENYLGGGYASVPAAYHNSSPVETATSQAPPTLLLHGRPDVLVAFEHTVRLKARLDFLQVPCFVVDLPWAAHGYDFLFSGPGSQISLYFLERFLAKVVK